MTYHKPRTVARIIATRLHELGARQVGVGIRLPEYQALSDGRLLPSDLIRQSTHVKWEVGDVLLLGQGLYQPEDAWVDDYYTWAGAHELTSITIKSTR